MSVCCCSTAAFCYECQIHAWGTSTERIGDTWAAWQHCEIHDDEAHSRVSAREVITAEEVELAEDRYYSQQFIDLIIELGPIVNDDPEWGVERETETR